MKYLKKVSTGELIPFYSATLSTDKSSYVWSFSAEIADAATLNKLKPVKSLRGDYVEIEFRLGLTTWNLVTEEPNYNDTSNQFSISARSKTVFLCEDLSEKITKTWINITPAQIIDELCSVAGIAYDFDNVEIWSWHIDNYTVTDSYPIDIIKNLIAEKGGIIQTLPNGTLFIALSTPCSPNKINELTGLFTISTKTNLFERSKKFINNKNYNSVMVTKQSDNLTDNSPSISVEEEQSGNDVLLKVVISPLCDVELTNVTGNVSVYYDGVHYRTVTDQIVVDDKKAQLSKPFNQLISVKWHQNELGELAINNKGEITAPSGFSVASITYNSPYHQYRIQNTQNIDAVGVKFKTIDDLNDISALSITYNMNDASNPAPVVVVNTLQTHSDLTVRAQQELWPQIYDMEEYIISAAYENFPIMPASVCHVQITKENLAFNAYVKSVSIQIGTTITQQVTVQRPLL